MLQVLGIELNIIAMYITRPVTIDQHIEVKAENLRSISALGINKLFALRYNDGTFIILKQSELKDFILYEMPKVSLEIARKTYKAFKALV